MARSDGSIFVHLILGGRYYQYFASYNFWLLARTYWLCAHRLIYTDALRKSVIEVESKYWSPGNSSVIAALNKQGAKRLSDLTMEDVYFAHPGRDFGKTDEALRLRKKEDGAELTYKGPRMKSASAKAREEITIALGDPLGAQRILERLGFKESHVVTKKRASFQMDKLRVEVDTVDGLGEFVELEVLTESPERAASLLETARTELGLSRLELKTYLELLIEKKEK